MKSACASKTEEKLPLVAAAERRNTSILSSALAAHNKHTRPLIAYCCCCARCAEREKGDRKLRGGASPLVMANFLSHTVIYHFSMNPSINRTPLGIPN
jgi:hypothetical protein